MRVVVQSCVAAGVVAAGVVVAGIVVAGVVGGVVIVGCPAAPGEGEGEGEGAAGEGEPDVPPTGTQILHEVDVKIEDAARDGSAIAFRDTNDVLRTITPLGDDDTVVKDAIGRAEFHGQYLIALRGDDGTGVFASGFVFPSLPSGAAELGDLVRSNSFDASPDGLHLYYELSVSADGLEDLYLDGTRLVTGASKEKTRFTFDSSALVVGANVPAVGGGSTDKFLKTFSTATATLIGDIVPVNASNENQVTRGLVGPAQVIGGAAEAGNICDIHIRNVDGTGDVTLASFVDDAGFKVTLDDNEVVFLTNTNVAAGGGIQAIHRDATGLRTILESGAVDLVAINATHIVFATGINPADNDLEDLSVVPLDGSGVVTALGSAALDDGFTSDGRFYLWRDNASVGVGDLHAFDTQTGDIVELARDVKKVVKASSTKIVSLSFGGTLRSSTLGGDTVALSSGVEHAAGIRAGVGLDAAQVAYSRTVDGIYVADLP